jgi:hypothetical protein
LMMRLEAKGDLSPHHYPLIIQACGMYQQGHRRRKSWINVSYK